ncbi:hypothetical protein LUTEI9C_50187 [Luteimonas sp. 9C]|nr:hypothetical protein LUTEI9C_50187 [Luteimonas sp. 9C]
MTANNSFKPKPASQVGLIQALGTYGEIRSACDSRPAARLRAGE